MDQKVIVDLVNSLPGWVREMGIRITAASVDEVACELEIGDKHHQGYGIVHGGVHCGLIESLASIGAALYALPRNQSVVGLENTTSFIRAVRAGAKLRATATPVTRGQRLRSGARRCSTQTAASSPPDACVCCASSRTRLLPASRCADRCIRRAAPSPTFRSRS